MGDTDCTPIQQYSLSLQPYTHDSKQVIAEWEILTAFLLHLIHQHRILVPNFCSHTVFRTMGSHHYHNIAWIQRGRLPAFLYNHYYVHRYRVGFWLPSSATIAYTHDTKQVTAEWEILTAFLLHLIQQHRIPVPKFCFPHGPYCIPNHGLSPKDNATWCTSGHLAHIVFGCSMSATMCVDITDNEENGCSGELTAR